MNIRFVSTLTAEDEGQLAPVLLRAFSALLDVTPIAYTLRIETLEGQAFQHSHPALVPHAEPVDSRTEMVAALRSISAAPRS